MSHHWRTLTSVSTTTNGRRDLRGEADFLPSTVEDLVELRRQLVAAGHPDQVASGILGWLVAKAAGDPDQTSPTTRATYRKILAGLEVSGPGGPGRGRRHLEPVRPAAQADSAEGPESTFDGGSVKHVARWRSPFRRRAA